MLPGEGQLWVQQTDVRRDARQSAKYELRALARSWRIARRMSPGRGPRLTGGRATAFKGPNRRRSLLRALAWPLGVATSRIEHGVQFTTINMVGSHQCLGDRIIKEVRQCRLAAEVSVRVRCVDPVSLECGNAPAIRKSVAAGLRRHFEDGFPEMQEMAFKALLGPDKRCVLAEMPFIGDFNPAGHREL